MVVVVTYASWDCPQRALGDGVEPVRCLRTAFGPFRTREEAHAFKATLPKSERPHVVELSEPVIVP